MKTDIFMPFYVGDYLKDTMHLSARDHGCYLLLILAYWNNGGPIPDDDEYLAGVAKCSIEEWASVRRRLERFFQVTPFRLGLGTGAAQAQHGQATAAAQAKPVWTHKRIDYELAKAVNQRKLASEKGKRGAAKANSQRVATTASAQAQHKRGTGAAQAEQEQQSGDATAAPQPKHRVSTSPSPSPISSPCISAETPSLDEVKALAAVIGLSEWKAEDWFNEMAGCGWLDYQHRHIQDWKAVLARVKAKWEAEGRPDSPPGLRTPQRPNGGAGGTAEIIRLQSELTRVEDRLKEILNQASHDAWGARFTDEQKSERGKLITRKRELLKALGFQA